MNSLVYEQKIISVYWLPSYLFALFTTTIATHSFRLESILNLLCMVKIYIDYDNCLNSMIEIHCVTG